VVLAALSACQSVSLTVANAPSVFGSFKSQRDIRYGNLERQRLDVYTPTDKSASRPIVVFVYGGGWVNGSKDDYRFIGDALTSRGFVSVLPDYRLHPQVNFPAFVDDIAQAVAWTQKHAADIGGDPSRLYLMGHSAGAHIATMIALNGEYLARANSDRSAIKGVIGISGPYDFLPIRDAYLHDVFGPDSRLPQSQPVNFVDAQAPPMLLMHGETDQVVWPSNSHSLARRLRTHNVSVTERYYPEMDHTDVMAALTVYFRQRRPLLNEIEAFIDRTPVEGWAESSKPNDASETLTPQVEAKSQSGR
jgi:acetyl esterase/lipase